MKIGVGERLIIIVLDVWHSSICDAFKTNNMKYLEINSDKAQSLLHDARNPKYGNQAQEIKMESPKFTRNAARSQSQSSSQSSTPPSRNNKRPTISYTPVTSVIQIDDDEDEDENGQESSPEKSSRLSGKRR